MSVLRSAAHAVAAVPRMILLALVWGYRHLISPWTPRTCRFYPSCSAYAEQALRQHGALRGGWLAIRRLGRCHPWTPGGVDPVPPPRHATPETAASPSTSTSTGA